MHDLLTQVQAALAERYKVVAEVGHGGMATVYRAVDVRYGRDVAVKVLRPELAAVLGSERFLREIAIAATLNHPHCIPLFDSGASDGLLYYVMPHVEGESLRDRIRRETQLPVADAVDITCQVAEALGYAHSRGIVHRDIKPDNILLTRGRALVADFGIARVLQAEGVEQLTSTGIAVGTPAYMSPEQASTSHAVDGRTDIYALGCMLFEMLIGDPPYTGSTARVIIARHAVEPVPSLRGVRDSVPVHVEDAVRTALAKTPADRFQTVQDLVTALTHPRDAPPVQSTRLSVSRPRRARSAAAIMLVLVTVLTASVLMFKPDVHLFDAARGGIDSTLLAVMPLGAARATDTSATDPAAGIPEMLHGRLLSDETLRTVDPVTVRSELAGSGLRSSDLTPADADGISRALGAGRFFLGQIVARGRQLVVSGSIFAVPGAREVARIGDVVGSGDSLTRLVDRLAVELLVRSRAPPIDDLGDMSATDLQALRAFLAGETALRRGQFAVAAERYGAAIEVDSSFAVAALALASVNALLRGEGDDRAIALAWQARDRLSPRRLQHLTALAGPRYPLESSERDRLAAWERAVIGQRGRAGTWYGMGEALLHSGPWLGVAGLERRAEAAFRRVLAFDARFAPAIARLLDLAAARRDTSAVRALDAQYRTVDSTSPTADYYRWRTAVALDDSAAVQQMRSRFDDFDSGTLERILTVAQLDGTGMDDAVAAGAAMLRKGATGRDARWAHVKLREVALNRGRPHEAAAVIRQHRGLEPTTPFDALCDIVEALFWGADSVVAATVVRERTPEADAPIPAGTSGTAGRYFDVCGVALWRVAHGELAQVPDAIAKLRGVPQPFDVFRTGYIGLCAAVLEAKLAVALNRADRDTLIARLDSLTQVGPPSQSWLIVAANLTVSALREEQGNLAAALAAARRRGSQYELGNPRVLVGLATFLREEGRLAALLGDREGAIRAWSRYLSLRDDPEPSVAAEVEEVRAALARLQAR